MPLHQLPCASQQQCPECLQNEATIASAIKASGKRREDLFITSKLAPNEARPCASHMCLALSSKGFDTLSRVERCRSSSYAAPLTKPVQGVPQ